MGTRPERIGPYRIDARLGSGGMGEVYRARDERLDRWVAIKVIRPEGAESAVTRERFRREARAAAALSHAAVVQIFDILEWEGGDAIVMELVAGESLAARIARGPVPLAEALRIGRDVASGLAAAHALGILHRDLKPENVMISPEGSAKILDFGLAKRLGADASITGDDRVLGTFRCMSPEQVRNLPLDHRSDLFSLGTLLYETLSGRSPFEGSSVLETLDRICNHRQTPLRQVAPAVPVELSDLVDDLLQKEPMRRPRSAREVGHRLEALASGAPPSRIDEDTWGGERPVVISSTPSWSYSVGRPKLRSALVLTLLACLAALLFLWRGETPVPEPPQKQAAPPAPEPIYVAVPKPDVSGGLGKEDVQMMSLSVRESLLQGLLSLEGLRPLAAEEVDGVEGSLRELARATAADEILTARLDCPGETCQISLSRVAGEDGRLLWTRTFSTAADRRQPLAEALRGYLRIAYGRKPRAGSSGLEARPQDYAEYLRLRRIYDVEREELAPEELLARLAALRETSPRFLEAYLFAAEILEQRYAEGRNPEDAERISLLLRQARGLDPGDPRALFLEAGLALRSGRLDRMAEVLQDLEELLPGDPRVLVFQGILLARKGRSEEAVELLETAARRQPSSWGLFQVASEEYRLGRFDRARAHLTRLLERQPGHYDAMSLLAQTELLYGSVERAAGLYRELVRRSEGTAELSNLGFAYLLLRRYPEAEQVFRQALEREPGSPAVQLNLADALKLQGKEAAAGTGYRRVLALTERAAADSQMLSTRAQALAHLGQGAAAVGAVQELLRIAPENPQVAYEISIVYLIIGDRTAALFNATRALKQGVDPRYFDFPWFAPLHSDPGFRGLLGRRSSGASS